MTEQQTTEAATEQPEQTTTAPTRVPNVSAGALSGLDHEVIGSDAHDAYETTQDLNAEREQAGEVDPATQATGAVLAENPADLNTPTGPVEPGSLGHDSDGTVTGSVAPDPETGDDQSGDAAQGSDGDPAPADPPAGDDGVTTGDPS